MYTAQVFWTDRYTGKLYRETLRNLTLPQVLHEIRGDWECVDWWRADKKKARVFKGKSVARHQRKMRKFVA